MNGFLENFVSLEVIALAAIATFSSVVPVDEMPKCGNVVLAQMAPRENGVPQQRWCCCGSCCNWAISCDAIPGCGSC